MAVLTHNLMRSASGPINRHSSSSSGVTVEVLGHRGDIGIIRMSIAVCAERLGTLARVNRLSGPNKRYEETGQKAPLAFPWRATQFRRHCCERQCGTTTASALSLKQHRRRLNSMQPRWTLTYESHVIVQAQCKNSSL